MIEVTDTLAQAALPARAPGSPARRGGRLSMQAGGGAAIPPRLAGGDAWGTGADFSLAPKPSRGRRTVPAGTTPAQWPAASARPPPARG